MFKLLSIICLSCLGLAACGDSTDCSTTADCFQGEVCSSGTCLVGDDSNSGNNGTGNNGTGNNGTGNNGTGNNGTGNNGTGNNGKGNNGTGTNGNNGTANNGIPAAACVVEDLFAHTCADDEFEPNDEKNRESVPFDALLWCYQGDLVTGSAFFEGRLCTGNSDWHRVLIDNRTPHKCLDARFSMRITVTLDKACPDLLDVRPYLFFNNPLTLDYCEDESVNCSWVDDRTRVIEMVITDESQLPSVYLMMSPLQEDIDVGYTVQVDIIKG